MAGIVIPEICARPSNRGGLFVGQGMGKTRSAKAAEYNHWYWSARWRKISKHQLAIEPCCRMCAAQGQTTQAKIADHIVPHKGDPDLFWYGELQSLCQSHHSSDKARIESGGTPRPITGLDGWPLG